MFSPRGSRWLRAALWQSWHLFLLISYPFGITGILVNRTIDDEYGDSLTGVKPTYGPSGSGADNDWKQGLDCVNPCVFIPNSVIDVSQTVNGTWHDATYRAGDGAPHTISAPFTGTAIYVYFIVPNFNPLTPTLVNLSFAIDGTTRGQYLHMPDSSTTILYHTLAFYTTDLTNTGHFIEIRADGPNDSLLLFDNMVYTAEEDGPASTSELGITSTSTGAEIPTPTSPVVNRSSSSTATPVGVIIGGVAAGVGVLGLIILALLLCLCQRPHRDRTSQPTPGFFDPPSAVDTQVPFWDIPPNAHDTPGVIRLAPASPRAYVDLSTPLEGGSSKHTKSLVPTTASRPTSKADGGVKVKIPDRGAVTPSNSPPRTHTPPTSTSDSTLHAQVAALQEEMARLRHVEDEMHQLLLVPPPRYDLEEGGTESSATAM